MNGVSRDLVCPMSFRGRDVEFCLKGDCAMFHELDNGGGFCALDPVDAAEAIQERQIERISEYSQIIESVVAAFKGSMCPSEAEAEAE